MPEATPPLSFLATQDELVTFAAAIAPRLQPGDTLLLDGPLGAGKTTFARALIQARLATAGRIEDIPSPTYTLVQTYDDGTAQIWHADLYRLDGAEEARELGLDEAFRDAIVLVEWPDRLDGNWPAGALRIRLDHVAAAPEKRAVFVEGAGGRWRDRLADLIPASADA